MTDPTDLLLEQLRRWGHATATRHVRPQFAANDDAPDDHPLARARHFAPMTRQRAAARLVGRDGRSRRKYMARDLGACGVQLVPASYVDPVPSKNTRSGSLRPDQRAGAIDVGIPDDLRWIDRALAELTRQAALQAQCLREEFTGTGSQRMKAARVAKQYAGQLSVWQYRRELQRGIDFLRGRAPVTRG